MNDNENDIRQGNDAAVTAAQDTGGSTVQTEDPELKWYREVYQGDHMKQLTVRAVVMGALLGGFMSLSNLYVGLKTGWGLGVAITACILSFAIWKTLMTIMPFLFKTEMSILENNCMQSTASSAGYSTGGTLTSAIAAYLLITGHHMPWEVLTLWTVFLAMAAGVYAEAVKFLLSQAAILKFYSFTSVVYGVQFLHPIFQEIIMQYVRHQQYKKQHIQDKQH